MTRGRWKCFSNPKLPPSVRLPLPRESFAELPSGYAPTHGTHRGHCPQSDLNRKGVLRTFPPNRRSPRGGANGGSNPSVEFCPHPFGQRGERHPGHGGTLQVCRVEARGLGEGLGVRLQQLDGLHHVEPEFRGDDHVETIGFAFEVALLGVRLRFRFGGKPVLLAFIVGVTRDPPLQSPIGFGMNNGERGGLTWGTPEP
jgi:hypothetical protein